MKNRIVIFCESYIQVENTLFLLDKYEDEKITIVIIGNSQVNQFFEDIVRLKKLANVEIIFIRKLIQLIPSTVSSFSKLLFSFREYRYVRQIYREKLAAFEQTEIYFATRFYSAYTYFFLNKLQHKNKVTYIPPKNYAEHEAVSSHGDLAFWLKKMRTKLVFGRGLEYHDFGLRQMDFIPDAFVKQNHEVDGETRKKMIKPSKLYQKYNVWESKSMDIFFFDTPFQRDGIRRSEQLNEDFEAIFSVINKYYPKESVGIKLHPGEEALFNYRQEQGSILQDYVMGEILLASAPKIVMGFWSAMMFSSPSPYVVSLLKLASFVPNKIKEEREHFILDRSEREVLFPETIDELEEILSRAKNA